MGMAEGHTALRMVGHDLGVTFVQIHLGGTMRKNGMKLVQLRGAVWMAEDADLEEAEAAVNAAIDKFGGGEGTLLLRDDVKGETHLEDHFITMPDGRWAWALQRIETVPPESNTSTQGRRLVEVIADGCADTEVEARTALKAARDKIAASNYPTTVKVP